MAVAARFLAGAGNGNIAVARAYIGDISEPQQVAKRMGMIGAAFGLGFMIGPFIGGVLSDPSESIGAPFEGQIWIDHPYLLPCLFSSALSLISFILAITRLPESLPEENRRTSEDSILKEFGGMFRKIAGVMKLPTVSSLVSINFLFLMGFSMMHGTFILFTSMDPDSGGLGWSELDNGWVFAFIGLLGAIVQGALIGPLTQRFRMSRLMLIGTLLCGAGIASIPYVPYEASWLIFGSSAGMAIGNGLFSPTQSSVLTSETKTRGYELGMVMGAQEGYGALARIFGPLTAAYIWSLTVQGDGFWTYHTSFRVAGIIFLLAILMQTRLRLSEDNTQGATRG